MSPRLPNKSRFAVFSTALGLVLIGGFVFLRPQSQCKAQERAPATPKAKAQGTPVQILTIKSQDLALPVPATGTLAARETVMLVSELSRRLTKIQAHEGQFVKKGTLLFQLDATDLIAEKRRVSVQLEFAERSAKRQRELLTAQVATAAELDSAEGIVRELEASRQILDVTLSKTSIISPFDGWLGLRQVSTGAWVTPSSPLITIADTSVLKIDFRVAERHASAIKVGGAFSIQVEGQTETFEGKITATEPTIDESSRTLLVRGVIEEKNGLRPGAFAQVNLPLVVPNTIVIPTLAVLPSVDGRSVFVAREGRAKRVSVELGARTEVSAQVLSGLAPGDQLIVSNLLRVKDGDTVIVEDKRP